jgi:hypothetical protein
VLLLLLGHAPSSVHGPQLPMLLLLLLLLEVGCGTPTHVPPKTLPVHTWPLAMRAVPSPLHVGPVGAMQRHVVVPGDPAGR